MKIEFTGGRRVVWRLLRTAFRARPRALVAVAFLGKGAHSRLRLRKGSVLVVNASEDAVRCGQTNPHEIAKFRRDGVLVFSSESLHAKVFVIGRTAFVGSANVSSTSENRLSEALIATTDHAVVASAREFVHRHKHTAIGPALLKSLIAAYSPPRFRLHGASSRTARDFVWAVPLVTESRSEQAQQAERQGAPKARRQLRDSKVYKIDNFQWSGAKQIARFGVGESVLQMVREDRKIYIFPLGAIVHVEQFVESRHPQAIIFIETAKRRRRLLWKKFKIDHGVTAKDLTKLSAVKKITRTTLLHILRRASIPPAT